MGPVCIATAVARRCAAVRSLKPAVAASAREEGRHVRILDSETAIQRLVTECFDSLEEQCTAADPWRCVPTLGTSSSCTVSATFASTAPINMMVIDDAADAGFIGAVTQVCVRPAADAGACDHVINPDELPDDAVVVPNATGKHFKGANDSVIENYGDVETILESDLGAVSCGWKAADVTRPLHSISKICGPAGGTVNSKQDVLFNNDVCVVVPPGIVAEILKRVTPVAAYAREGSLYVGDMVLSSFTRQGPKA